MRSLVMILAAAAVLGGSAPADDAHLSRLGDLRINEVQYVSTHNSYHLEPDAAILRYLRESGYRDGPEWDGPELAKAIGYSHPPLTAQLDMGLRAFELDVHDDPAGGRLAHPPIFGELVRRGERLDSPWDPAKALAAPGFKTLHKAAYDPRSTCPILRDCLTEIAQWSATHPDHVPIIVMIETKRDPAAPESAACADLCPDGWARLTVELQSVFDRPRILAPADVGSTWPTLREARGKVMFLLLDSEEAAAGYRAQAKANGIDLIFTPQRPSGTAGLRKSEGERWVVLPKASDSRILTAQRRGLLVYTRADAHTEEARRNDVEPRNRAMASGANFIATDFPVADKRYSGYHVRFSEGRYVRCNPVTAQGRCKGRD